MKHRLVPYKSQSEVKVRLRDVVLRVIAVLALVAVLIAGALAQSADTDPAELKLPNGKSWPNEIAKADYKNNLKDAKELARLSAEVQNDLEAGDPFVLPLKTIKKVEEVEKLAKDLRTRLRRN